ncbi:unnamed protein product [Durusdinium trenchii]|uniref:SET domain-containing protein n=1 Tax=Durusdinium trenchii TaxID=1381693 RepID=A0ABP0JAL4_9DINO
MSSDDAEGGPEKRARKDTLRLPRGFAQRGDPSAGALRAALLRGAALWHEGLKRSQALQVPGLVVDQPIAADTVLLRIPKELHFSRPRCEEIFKNLYEACEALPSADPEKRAEAADALCFAKVLQSCAAEKCTSTAQRECQGPSTWPEAWGHVAATLLSNVEDFADHPYVAAWEGRMPQLCSAEPELIAAQAQYVRTVYGCLQSTVTEMPKELDEGLFAFSWLCLLTRRFRGPEGSALVPGVDFLNHSSKPNAASEWDEASGSIVVTSLVDLQPGDEVCISYGNLSNPLLFRTYGFTLPCEFEPCCSCTFTQEELVAGACAEAATAQVQDLPNLHLNSSFVTDELAELLQAYPSGAGKLLRLLCAERLEKMDEKSKELKISTSTNHASHASRVLRSEYLCLRLHVQILDELAGQPSETSTSAQDLKHELQLLHQAGMLAV